MNQNSEKNDKNFIKAIVISKISGEFLLDLIFDSNINPILLSSFAGALSLFGKDNLGKIQEITVKGLDLEMIIVTKYDLILIAIIDKEYFRNNVRDEAKKALDMFYLLYQDDIEDSLQPDKFASFKKILELQIEDYLNMILESQKQKEVKNFGLWEIFEKCRDKIKEDQN
jgi:hypothetical protein